MNEKQASFDEICGLDVYECTVTVGGENTGYQKEMVDRFRVAANFIDQHSPILYQNEFDGNWRHVDYAKVSMPDKSSINSNLEIDSQIENLLGLAISKAHGKNVSEGRPDLDNYLWAKMKCIYRCGSGEGYGCKKYSCMVYRTPDVSTGCFGFFFVCDTESDIPPVWYRKNLDEKYCLAKPKVVRNNIFRDKVLLKLARKLFQKHMTYNAGAEHGFIVGKTLAHRKPKLEEE